MSDAALSPTGITLGKGREAEESVLLAMRERAIGGSSAVFLGVPGSGKSALAYLMVEQRRREERVFVRGNTDDGWWWWFGRDALVWVPEGCTAEVYGLAGESKIPIDADVRTYASGPDLMERAELGKVNVLYWPGEGWGRWVSFLAALVDRDDRLPQLVLDDEAHETFPESGFGGEDAGEQPFDRIKRFIRILAHSRRAEVSYLLAGHQGFDIHYAVLGKMHYTLLLAGSRVPRHVEQVASDEVLYGLGRICGRLHRGRAVAVGPTPAGYVYEEVGSDESPIPPPPMRQFTVVVRVGGWVGSPPPSTRMEGIDSGSEYSCSDCGHRWRSRGTTHRCPREECRSRHVAPTEVE